MGTHFAPDQFVLLCHRKRLHMCNIKIREYTKILFKFLPEKCRGGEQSQSIFAVVMLNKKMSSLSVLQCLQIVVKQKALFAWVSAVFRKAKVLVCLLPFSPVCLLKLAFLFLENLSAQKDVPGFMRDF